MKKKVMIICITIIIAIVIVALCLSKEYSRDWMKTKVIQDFQNYRDSFEIICKDLEANYKNLEANYVKEIYKKNYAEYSSEQNKKAYECILEKLNYDSIMKDNENIIFQYTKGKYNLELIYSKNPEDNLKYYDVLDENWYYLIFMYE